MSAESIDEEHSIEYGSTGTWQADTIHWALCECGWQSQRIESREVVEAEVRRHLAAPGPSDV